jgi:hypothetical protein
MEYRPSRSRVAGHGGGGHHGGGRLRGAFGPSTFDLYGPGYGESDDYLPVIEQNFFTVGISTNPQSLALQTDTLWQRLNGAVLACGSGMPTAQISMFQEDYETWTAYYNQQAPSGVFDVGMPPIPSGMPEQPAGSNLGEGPGALVTVYDWFRKAQSWQTTIAASCGDADLPPVVPDPSIFGPGTHDLAVMLESVAVLAVLGLGVWFLWPMLVGAKKVGI